MIRKATLERMAECAAALVDVVKSRRLVGPHPGQGAPDGRGLDHPRRHGRRLRRSSSGPAVNESEDGYLARAVAADPRRSSRRRRRGECSRQSAPGELVTHTRLRTWPRPARFSRALRAPLGQIVTLAGYDATAEEEMPASTRHGRASYRGRRHDLLPLRRVGQARPGAGRPLVLRRRRLLQLLRTLATGGIAQSTPRATARRPAQCRSSSGRLQAGSIVAAPRRGGVCSRCKAEPIAERLVVRGLWVCGRCVYEFEHGPGEPVSRSRTREPQTETLFPLDEVGTGNPTVAAAGRAPARPPAAYSHGDGMPVVRRAKDQPCCHLSALLDRQEARREQATRFALPLSRLPPAGSLTSAMIVVCEPVRSRARRPAGRSRSLTPGASR